MNIIFVGTSDFAVPSLEALIASHHDVLAVVTQPDRPSGRGHEMQASPIKDVALAHGISVMQPEKIGDSASMDAIMEYTTVGAMVVVAYGQKIPTRLLLWPPHGVVNVHGSILPKYRGAAPIQYALIMGEKQTGVTTMLMDDGWDTGDILLQDVIDIGPEENAGELSLRLSIVGANLLIRTLNDLETGLVNPIPQDEDLATSAHSLGREAGTIDWSAPAESVVNLVRGCTPKPGAFTKLKGNALKVSKSKLEDIDGRVAEPGRVTAIDKEGVVVAAGSGSVRLLEVQAEGRQKMSAAEYARGIRLAVGDRFDVAG